MSRQLRCLMQLRYLMRSSMRPGHEMARPWLRRPLHPYLARHSRCRLETVCPKRPCRIGHSASATWAPTLEWGHPISQRLDMALPSGDKRRMVKEPCRRHLWPWAARRLRFPLDSYLRFPWHHCPRRAHPVPGCASATKTAALCRCLASSFAEKRGPICHDRPCKR